MSTGAFAEQYQAAERFVDWLASRVVNDATGTIISELQVDPSGLFWLGRLAPEAEISQSVLGERAERLEPCAVGMRLTPNSDFGETVLLKLECRFVVWIKSLDKWKSPNLLSEPQSEK